MYKTFARPVTDEWYHRKGALKTMLYEIQFYPTGVRERDVSYWQHSPLSK